MSSRRRTIKDVAQEAHVSISTVSLVMNGKGYVSSRTRERVLTIAQRLGYVPTRAARDLARQKTGNVGFVLREDHFTRSEPFYTRIFLGAEFEARGHNVYVLLATIPRAYDSALHKPRFLRERNVDGLLVAGKVHPAFLEDAQNEGVPIVLIDFETGDHPAVVIDNQGGAREAVEHLVQEGHERIAFIGADLPHPSLSARLDGYRLAMAAHDLPVNQGLILSAEGAEPTRATGTHLGDRLLALEPRPTAVFCANDALALGALDALARAGISVPDDVAVIGFDDVGGSSSTVSLTSVRVFKEQLGELALRYLMETITKEEARQPSYRRGSHRISVPTELVIRASTRSQQRALRDP